MIPGDLLSAFPHRQFHTLPDLLDSWAALPNSYPNACVPMQGGSWYHFYDGLWYDPAERRTHDLPRESRTRYRLSQPDTVSLYLMWLLTRSHNMINHSLQALVWGLWVWRWLVRGLWVWRWLIQGLWVWRWLDWKTDTKSILIPFNC